MTGSVVETDAGVHVTVALHRPFHKRFIGIDALGADGISLCAKRHTSVQKV